MPRLLFLLLLALPLSACVDDVDPEEAELEIEGVSPDTEPLDPTLAPDAELAPEADLVPEENFRPPRELAPDDSLREELPNVTQD